MGAQKAATVKYVNKIMHYIVFIFAFVYLVMCPSVHQVSESIRHDISVKLETKASKQNLKRNLAVNPLKIITTAQTSISVHFRKLQKISVFLLSPFTLDLSMLCTVRLIL